MGGPPMARARSTRPPARWEERDAFIRPSQRGATASTSRPRRHSPPATCTSGTCAPTPSERLRAFQRARGSGAVWSRFDAFGCPPSWGRSPQVPAAVGDAMRRAHEPAQAAPNLLRLGAHVHELRRGDVHWSQSLFLTLLDAGCIYHGSGSVDWCDTCQTTLRRSKSRTAPAAFHNPVRLIHGAVVPRISAYLEENDRRTGSSMERDLAFQPELRAGRAERGVELQARRRRALVDRVHPPRRGHSAGALLLISPEHPRSSAGAPMPRWASSWRRCALAAGSAARAAGGGRAGGHRLHRVAIRGWTTLPLLISPAVDERFGATAVFGIPNWTIGIS